MYIFALIIAILSFSICVFASVFLSTSGSPKRRNAGLRISLSSILVLSMSGVYLFY